MAKTFFYKNKKDKIIAMEEREASLTGKFYEHIGTSDGKTYESIVRGPRNELNSAQANMNEYLKTNRPVPDDVYNRFSDARTKFQEACSLAFEKELEVAKANKTKPQSTEWSSMDGQNISRPRDIQ